MTCKDFYDIVGGDYEDTVNRFMSEENVLRFIRRFLTDTSFSSLVKGMSERDIDLAYRAVHTLKGIAQSLGFTELGKSAAALTEVLRKKTFDGSDELFVTVQSDYDKAITAIKQFLNL